MNPKKGIEGVEWKLWKGQRTGREKGGKEGEREGSLRRVADWHSRLVASDVKFCRARKNGESGNEKSGKERGGRGEEKKPPRGERAGRVCEEWNKIIPSSIIHYHRGLSSSSSSSSM